MQANDKSFLVKKIVSADGPKAAEVEHEASLVEWCATCIEPEEESNRRRVVLERIHNIVRVWIRHTMITEFRLPEAAAAQVEGRIFATGSYRYNVHSSGSDIDMVLIAPSRITREHFFNTLAQRLRNDPSVSELHCVRESRVPIIAMVCDGIDIDLSFGSIRKDRVPEVITDDLLQGLDEQSVLSCNAVRVAHNIMDLVPNKATFRQTLRFVKAWGKVRAIYSNTFGFPSGIGWAILVAFVCQCYPKQNAAGLVTRFFRTYHAWFKPNPHESGVDNRAIYLTESMRAKTHLGRCWDPRESKSDAMALFPVLTPALPYGNACYNVTLTNLKQLCEEFKRGYEILSADLGMSRSEAKEAYGPYGVWSRVLTPVKFFGEYPHYLHVQVSSLSSELYQAYVDAVESKIRILWAGNASSRGRTLEDCKALRLHLNPRRFEDPVEAQQRRDALAKKAGESGNGSSGGEPSAEAGAPRDWVAPDGAGIKYTAHYFIGITVDATAASNRIDLTPAIRTFHTVVKQLRQYHEGITKLPSITVDDMRSIPQFVKSAVGYTEPTAATPKGAASAAAAVDGGGGEACKTSTTGGGFGAEAMPEGLSTEVGNTLSTVDGPIPSNAVGASGSAAAAKPADAASPAAADLHRKRDREDTTADSDKQLSDRDDLEQALGLDF